MNQESIAGRQVDARTADVTALRLIECLLYLYAVYSLFVELLGRANRVTEITRESDPLFSNNVWAVTIFFLAAFVMLIIRIYIDIKSIDYEYFDRISCHSFVRKNTGGFRVCEKVLRVLIVFSVILSAKVYSGAIFAVFHQSVEAIQHGLTSFLDVAIPGNVESMFGQRHLFNGLVNGGPDEQFHQIVEYYSTILVAVSLLLITWDLVNSFSVQGKFRANAFYYGGRSAIQKENNETLFSFLDFIGTRDYDSGADDLNHYSSSIRRASGRPRDVITKYVKSGKIWLLYLRYSPRFRERGFLLLFALSALVCSRTELNVFAIFSMASCISFYYIYMREDSRVKSGAIDLVTLPWQYFFKGVNLGLGRYFAGPRRILLRRRRRRLRTRAPQVDGSEGAS